MATKTPSSAPRRNSSGLARDVEVLEALGMPEAIQAGGLGVVRIADLTGREKTVISRTLATLADAGLVSRDPDTLSYRLGSRLFALAARTAEATLVAEARPYLRRIARHTGETSHLSVLRGGNVLTLLSELSPYEFRTAGWEGVTTAAWRTPSGRVLLSDWEDEALVAWYEQHGHDQPMVGPGRSDLSSSRFTVLETPSPDSVMVRDLDDLRAEVSLVRERGYAISDEELEVGVVAASAPVTDFTGRIMAAVNVSAPKARIPGHLDALGEFMAKATQPLSTHLGGL